MAASLLAARVEQEAQLGGGEQIVRRVLGEDAKLGFGLAFAAHAQEQVAQFAAQIVIGRVQRQRLAELVDERVARRQEFAGHLGGARFAPAGGGQQRGSGVVRAAHGQPDAAQVHQHGAAVGQQAPGAFEMRGGEREFVALLGEGGELEVPAEVVGAQRDGLLPARDAGGQGVVDVVEGLLGGGVAGSPQAGRRRGAPRPAAWSRSRGRRTPGRQRCRPGPGAWPRETGRAPAPVRRS